MTLKNYIKKNKGLYSVLSAIKNFFPNKRKKLYDTIFSNVLEGTLLIELDNIPGKFEIDARSHILQRILLTKEYEPKLVRHILNHVNRNMDAINIGANIGLYSNLLADNINNTNKVLAIEPTNRAFSLLTKNITLNNNENKIIPFNGIASSENGEFNLNIIEGMEEYSSIGTLVHASIQNEKFTSQVVKGKTLDYLVEKYELAPGIIVIDVEGAELSVLKGSIGTIKKFKPIIISELDDVLLSEQNATSREVIKFLKDYKYKVLDIDNNVPTYPFSGNIIAYV
ncbi:FkbM family methyltransferase [Flavobacteriaceae bacterium F08102]|nr:FkbM family methyltransferase [Flavobacteriaceae bacterium F08102]